MQDCALPAALPGRKGMLLRLSDALRDVGITEYQIKRGAVLTVYTQEDAAKILLFFEHSYCIS